MSVTVNIYDPPYNCRGDNTDSWDGWMAAMEYVSQNGGGTVIVPPVKESDIVIDEETGEIISGQSYHYYLRRPLYFFSGVSLVFTDPNTPVVLNYYISDADRLNGYEFSFGNIKQYGHGNTDISIYGGVWDCNAYIMSGTTIVSSQRKIFANGAYNIGFQFIRVNNLNLDTLTIKNTRNWGTLFNQCHGVTLNAVHFLQNMSGVPDNQDGIHFLGENSNILCTNIGGTTNDDIFALTTADTSLGPRVKFGPISGVVLDGLNLQNSLNGVRIGLAGELIDDVTIRNVSGTVKNYRPVNIEAYNYFKPFGYAGRDKIGTLTFENINIASQSPSYPMFYTDLNIDKLVLKNITKNGYLGQPMLHIADNSTAESYGQIRDLVIDGVNTIGTNSAPLILNDGVIHNATIKNWNGAASTFIQYSAKSGYSEKLNIFDNATFSSKVSVGAGRSVTVDNYTSATPPSVLDLFYPEGEDRQTGKYYTSPVLISGQVTPGATVTVGGAAVSVAGDGTWSKSVPLASGHNNIPVVATVNGISITKYAYFDYAATPLLQRPRNLSYDGTNLTWDAVPNAVSYRVYHSSSDGRSDGRSSWGDGGVQNPGPFLQDFIFSPATRRYPNSSTVFVTPSCNFALNLVSAAWYLVSVSAVDSGGTESPLSYQREVMVGGAAIYPDAYDPPPPPSASPRTGRYGEAQTVTINNIGGKIVLCTTDGSDPRSYIVTDNGIAQFVNGVLQTTGEVN